jgi:16S rRNA (guanine966-N2)-methyltransferase
MDKPQVRIIGGLWRGRKLPMLDVSELRPTPDRVRETVFNWLMHDCHDAICLDAFAGTGALGFEALSRGAQQVIFCEKSKKLAEQLIANAARFDCTKQAMILNTDFFVTQFKQKFDIIFLDPPFRQNLVPLCLELAKKISSDSGLIYLEAESELELITDLEIIKEKQAGKVKYYLLKNS